MNKVVLKFALLTVSCFFGGCSTVMEAERPSATNLNTFAPGERRIDVIARVGPPLSSLDDDGLSCDVYKMHTKGTNNAEKAGIIFGEAAADFFTLGLAEVALTPAEAASKAGLHTILFCYDHDQKLASLKDGGVNRMISPAVAVGGGATKGIGPSGHQQ